MATPSGTTGEITIADLGQRLRRRSRHHQEGCSRQQVPAGSTAEADRAAALAIASDAAARDAGSLREEVATLRARLDEPKRRRTLDSIAAEPAGRDQRRPRQDHQALRRGRHRRRAGAAHRRIAAKAGAWQRRHLPDAGKQPQGHATRRSPSSSASRSSARSSATSTGASSPPGDSREPELAGIRGALVGSALTLLVTLALCLPIGVAGGDLSRGVRAQEPAHRPHRGQHQQPRGRALDRLRPARPRDVPQLLRRCRARRRWSAAWCWRCWCCRPSSSPRAPR